jgi:4-hydroxybenzoate polyprenyltransferase
MDNFLRRNPILKTKRQFHIDSARVNGATTEIIRKWFQKLALSYIKTIKPENLWNIDKAGIIEEIEDNSLVVRSAYKRFIQKKQPGSRAWTSFIECISALGRALHPLVIFKGKSVQQQWFKTILKEFKG